MKILMTGNEAIARGVYEAGVKFASAYPGTPSTEILENISTYKAILAEWAPNEKVAIEAAIGGSIAGARTIASMKHVGVNVAADPLFTFAYTGVNGGMVLVTADEPGQHSSQNEQDNRNYAKFAKIPMVEPSDSQEAKDMLAIAYQISEEYDTPVLCRMTTRVCHSKSIVELSERQELPIRPYKKDVTKYMAVPAFARKMRVKVEDRMNRLKEYSETTPLNYAEMNSTKIGVVVSGGCVDYAKEAFGKEASYLKLGFTNPLPVKLIADFAAKVETVYVIEENDPYIEEFVRLQGIVCRGKDTFPYNGEMTPDVIRKSVYGADSVVEKAIDKNKVVGRPPMLCAGCPHRGVFYELGKMKNVMVAGDIGCYSLAFDEPYNAVDFNLCMGGSFSCGHGAQKVFNMVPGNKMRVVSVLGDSTFFHTGINSLIEVYYNKSNTVNLILDNRITGMTGHQENPTSGYTAQGEPTDAISIEAVVRAIGFEHVAVINPNNLADVKKAIKEGLERDEPSVIITRWPCALKKFSKEDMAEFENLYKDKYAVEAEKCIGCKLCLKAGCPAISFDKEANKAVISRTDCLGCGVCGQVCPKNAIVKEG